MIKLREKYGLNHYHFRGNLGDRTCDGLSISTIVSDFKLNWVAYLEMLDIPIKLAEMEKETSLAFTALNEPVGMLQKEFI